MKDRTKNPNRKNYKYYGGKGITVCAVWENDFISFRDWALQNGYTKGLSLDRIDNDKGYEPDNCRWATKTQQARNQGTRGENKSGVKGVKTVTGLKRKKRWAAYITVSKKQIYLGRFSTVKKAEAARKKAEREYWKTDS
jgi:hypothetical protein